MKAGSRLLNAMLLGWCATVGCAGLLRGQGWQPIMEAGVVTNLVTTGGVTYVEYTWLMTGCDSVASIGPLLCNGNNFSFDFDIEQYEGICPDFAFYEGTNVVLGALAPGTYTLTTTSWNVPMSTNIFTISNITPVLQPIGFDTNGFFQIQMSSGVTNVSYVLQCSTNLVDWTSLSTNSVSTNSVGVALTDNAPVLPGVRYYRVLCQ
jgi:hypothetical protein